MSIDQRWDALFQSEKPAKLRITLYNPDTVVYDYNPTL